MEPPETSSSDDEERIIGLLLGDRPADRLPRALVDAGDDAAVTRSGEAVTVDTLVQGVHWDDRLSPSDVGFKALAVSVSDLAAMGARPEWALLSLALPQFDAPWIKAFSRGMAEACTKWQVDLVGGDTVRTAGPIVVSVVLGGRPVSAPWQRSGARPGDDLYVTGTLGLAGLAWSSTSPDAEASSSLRRPDPPLAFALDAARAGWVHAAMDLSDGLARDLPRLTAASGVGALVDPAALPFPPSLGARALSLATCGGEDYQLLIAAPPSAARDLHVLARSHGIRWTRIGEITPPGPTRLLGMDWPVPLFRHFTPREPT